MSRPFLRLNYIGFPKVYLQFHRYVKESPLIKKSPHLADLEIPVTHTAFLFSVFKLYFYNILTVFHRFYIRNNEADRFDWGSAHL